MIHYQIGQKVGDFTISSYASETGTYTLTCKCGKTSIGDSTHITRKISNLMAEGFTACQTCYGKYKAELLHRQSKDAELFVHKDVYREYVRKAKERDIQFTISLEECAPLFKSPCYYCGTAPANKRTRDTGITAYYQGLDRIDNKIGYVKENIVPCCKYCNSFKMDRTQEEFYDNVSKIYFKKVQRLEQSLVGSSDPKQETSFEKEEDIVYSA